MVRHSSDAAAGVAPQSLTAPLPSVPLSGRILLAEDGPDNQKLLALILRECGAEVTVAENGRIAVELALAADAAGDGFGVILMDMQMPEMDGWAATSTLRSKGYRGPIVALTANAMAEDRALCLQAGCTDYLSKPVNEELLLTTVQRHLRSTPAALVAEPLRSTLASSPRMARILPEFIADLPKHVGAIASLLREGDMDQLRRRVHQLKGAGGGYGFPDISRRAAEAEDAIKRQAGLDEIRAQIDQLTALIRRVEGYTESPAPGARGDAPCRHS